MVCIPPLRKRIPSTSRLRLFIRTRISTKHAQEGRRMLRLGVVGSGAIAVRRILHANAFKALSAPPLGGGRSTPPWTQTSSASDWWGRRLSISGEREGRSEVELCSAGGGRWLLRPRLAVVSVEHRVGFWRGYAASGHSGPRKHNPGQRGGGVGGPPFHVVVNQEIKVAQTVTFQLH